MMTSRERVKRAVKFQGPDKIPLGIMPAGYPTDISGVGVEPDPNWKPKIKSDLQNEDEFGCIWTKLHGDKTMGQVTFHPLSDYSFLNGFRFPDYKNPARYENARTTIKNNTANKFILAHVPISFIHRLEYLRGHEAAWTDPYDHPDHLKALLSRLADVAIDAIDRFAELDTDGIMSCDDWGLQDRPMVSPDIFKEFWKPAYRRVYHHARQRGLLTFLHSCGNIADLFDHLIDAELDVIQIQAAGGMR